MNLTAVSIPVPEGGYTTYIPEIPGAIWEGETIEDARQNPTDALHMVVKCNRELTRALITPLPLTATSHSSDPTNFPKS